MQAGTMGDSPDSHLSCRSASEVRERNGPGKRLWENRRLWLALVDMQQPVRRAIWANQKQAIGFPEQTREQQKHSKATGGLVGSR